MAGKIYQIAFQLAGKLGSNFASTFLSAQKHISGLDTQIKKLKADMKSGGNKTELQAQIAGLTAQKAKFTAAQQAADKFKSSVGSAFKSAAITVGVATTAVGAYYAASMKLADGVMEYAKHARSAAAITGTSSTWYESMSYAAKVAGVSVENLDKSLGKMTINLGQAKQGNKEMIEIFNKLGVSQQELSNMNSEQAFSRITQGLNGITDAAVRTDIARKVFGKIGTSMIPLAKLGTDGIKRLQEEAKKMGVVLNEESIKQARGYQIAKSRFDAVWSGTKLNIGQSLMPGLASGMKYISKLAVKYQPAIKKFAGDLGAGIKDSMPEILKVIKSMGNVAGAIYGGVKAVSNMIGGFHNLVYVGAAWIGLKMAISFWDTTKAISASISSANHAYKAYQTMGGAVGIWSKAQWALNAAMSANPVGLVIIGVAALAAAGYLVYKNWDKISAFFSSFWMSCKAGFAKLATGIVGAWQGFLVFWSKLPSKIAYGVGYIVGYIASIPARVYAFMSATANAIGNGIGYMVGYISTLPQRVSVFVTETATAMRTTLGEGVNSTIQFFVNLPANVSGALSSFQQQISAWASSCYDAVLNWFSKIPDLISNMVSNAGNALKNLFTGAGSSFSAGAQAGASMPGHAEGGIFNKEHIARFAEDGKKEAAIPLEGNRSRGLSLWAQAGQMLGVGKSPGGNAKSSGRSRSGIVYNDNRVFNINGDTAAVQTGIDKSNSSLMDKLRSLQNEEERVSYA